MKKTIFIFIWIMLATNVKAQFADTLREVFKYKRSIDARLESRNSFINNELISVTGVRLGVAFQRKLRIGGGLSWLKTEVENLKFTTQFDGKSDTLISYLKFVYFCTYADFVFYKTKRWQLSVPIQAGTGASWFQLHKNYKLNSGEKKYFLLLYEPGITAQFKAFKWLGVGADVAYRFTLKNNKKVGEKLNSPTYSFKILIWFDQLYYDMFPKSKITNRFGPSYW